MGHTKSVGSPIKKKRNGTGHPKCLVCALADVPAGAPLLKVYAYGSFGARFFWAIITPIDCVAEPLLAQNPIDSVWRTAQLLLLRPPSPPAANVYRVCVCLDDASEPPR